MNDYGKTKEYIEFLRKVQGRAEARKKIDEEMKKNHKFVDPHFRDKNIEEQIPYSDEFYGEDSNGSDFVVNRLGVVNLQYHLVGWQNRQMIEYERWILDIEEKNKKLQEQISKFSGETHSDANHKSLDEILDDKQMELFEDK